MSVLSALNVPSPTPLLRASRAIDFQGGWSSELSSDDDWHDTIKSSFTSQTFASHHHARHTENGQSGMKTCPHPPRKWLWPNGHATWILKSMHLAPQLNLQCSNAYCAALKLGPL